MPRAKADPHKLAALVAEAATEEEQEIGFLTHLLTQTNLPYKDPGAIPVWTRHNGNVTLHVDPGKRLVAPGTYQPIYPFGLLPRLLLIWMSSQAVKTRSPQLVLGSSLSTFMRDLGLQVTGGRTGTITRMRDQMERLLKSRLSVEISDGAHRDRGGQMTVALAWNLFWEDSNGNGQDPLFPSTIQLSTDFFNQVVEHPVPLNMRALAALRAKGGSPMRVDIYAWLTWRYSWLRRPTVVPWEMLMVQFGTNSASDARGRAKFRELFKANLADVLRVYPDAKVEATPAGLRLLPSFTHVPLRGMRQLKAG
ncbi:replication protein RepA [Polymorphospora sp. NPDC050346]|uniref:replication protein RepA n=1 Tax=Polymorphospora sp. NPDC050346 TaxID=3155780 RepID=UPI0033D88114